MEVPLTLQSTGQGSSIKKVKVTVEEKASAMQPNEKRLHVLLTDPTDPFFFFSLVLTESDFQNLRSQQGLLVDFASFASMIEQLLRKCIDEAQSESPKFGLVLDHSQGAESPQAVLNFQEINPYRRLCHLSLKVCRGSDTQVKEYLADCIKKLQRDYDNFSLTMEGRNQELQTQLDRLKSQVGSKTAEFESLLKKYNEEQLTSNSRMSQELAKEKERSARELAEMQVRYDTERRQLAETQMKTMRQMENRIASLDYENKDLMERRHKNEAIIQRCNERLKSQEEDLNRLQQEVSNKRSENHKLDTDFNRKEKAIGQLHTKISLLEQEHVRIMAELEKQKELHRVVNEQKIRLEQEVLEKSALISRRETAAKNVSQELLKANEIIKKFQNQVKSEHHKVKISLRTIEENENIIESKDKELNAMREEVKLAAESQRKDVDHRNELTSQVKALQGQVADLEKKLSTNETVIAWLNKQLTTAQARDPGLRLAPPPDGIRTFTPSGMAAFSTPTSPSELPRPRTVGRSQNINHEESIQLRSAGRKKMNQKENNLPQGLDDKYFQANSDEAEAAKGLLKPQNTVLPCNVKQKNNPSNRGGLLRRPPAAASSKFNSNLQPIDSVYFPKT